MLLRRLATALVFVIPFLVGILTQWPGNLILAAMAAGCSIWGLAEFFNLAARIGANPPRYWISLQCIVFPIWVYGHSAFGWSFERFPIGIAASALGVLAAIVYRGEVKGSWVSFLAGFGGPVYILGPILLIQVFNQCEHGFWFIFFVFLTTWLSDTGAYFGGRAFGKHKLAPKISPGKTVEGLASGFLFSLITVFAVGWVQMAFSEAGAFYWTTGSASDLLRLGLLNLGLVATGNLGDLAESMLKRDLGVKDSGSGLTGHGGFLDIMDSLLVNVPLLFVWALSFEDLRLL